MTPALAQFLRDEVIQQEGIRKQLTRRAMLLFAAGTPAESAWFVDSGYIKLVRRAEGGKEMLLGLAGPGELVGEELLFRPGQRSYSAEVMQDGLVYEIPYPTLHSRFERRPDQWSHLAAASLDRIHRFEDTLARMCLYDVETRILLAIEELSNFFGGGTAGTECAIPLSQAEIASLVGATRETTSTTLNALARAGLLRLGRRQMTALSVEAVAAAAQERGTRARAATA